MNLEYIFPTPIWQDQLNCDLFMIKNYIESVKSSSEGRKISNVGGWQSDDCDLEQLMETPVCQFITLIKKKMQVCFQDYGCNKTPVLSNLWFNINGPGSYNTTHIHTDSFLSGVFYIKCPENSGSIIFERQSQDQYVLGTYSRNNLDKIASTHWKYQPRPQMLIMFPSWIPHSVEINNSDRERISISFNVAAV